MASTPFAAFVGSAGHNEFSSGVPIPAAARVGDLSVICFIASRTMSGGSGGGWSTFTTNNGQVKVSWKQLELADLTVPLVLNADAPVTVLVWRGPTKVSAQRTSGSGAAPSSPTVGGFTMMGFDKSLQTVGLVGFTLGINGSAELHSPPWQDGAAQGPTSFRQATYSMTTLSNYPDGAGINVTTGFGPGTGYAAVHELLA
jgi:hypothetical protein